MREGKQRIGTLDKNRQVSKRKKKCPLANLNIPGLSFLVVDRDEDELGARSGEFRLLTDAMALHVCSQ